MPVQPDTLIVDEPQRRRFRVHRDTYVSSEVFDHEIKRFFHQGWVYAAHESQLPQPQGFITTAVGRQQLLITRDADGVLRAFQNRCRHRGAVVCKERHGTAPAFRCPYHGWSYNNAGALIGVPSSDGYPDNFPKEELGLTPVGDIASYRGFIFISLIRPPVSLIEHLGQARAFLDRLCDQHPAGIEVAPGTVRYGYDANWKLQVENALDFYHLPLVHRSFFEIKRARGESGKMSPRDFATDQCIALDRGHGTVLASDTTGHVHQHLYLFPNLVILENPAPQLRIINPLTVNRTEVEGFAYFSKDAPKAERMRLLGLYERFYGPMGFGTPDDIEVFHSCMTGFAAGESPWNDYSRGYHRELGHLPNGDETPVQACGNITDETFMRGLYRWWAASLQP